jgi:hypothetical protein
MPIIFAFALAGVNPLCMTRFRSVKNRLETVGWRLETVGWRLEAGGWRLEEERS